MLIVKDGERQLLAQRNAHWHVSIYVTLVLDNPSHVDHQIDFYSANAARDSLLNRFAGWPNDLIGLIKACNDAIVPRPICALPVGFRWTHRPGVTLIGDAAHVMSPAGGHGVNAALRDAAELAEFIIHQTSLNNAIRAYENSMFVRTEPIAQSAARSLIEQFMA